MKCIFCNEISDKIIMENELFYARYDEFPLNNGHVLIIPKRHFESFFEATENEIRAAYDLIQKSKIMLDKQYNPDGYNIGINIGKDAGQTVFHLHIHLIPRYIGDVENPRGGITNFKKRLIDY